MFTNFTIALVFSIGAGGWIYAKMQQQNGGQAKQSLMAAGIGGLVLLLVLWMILGMIFKS